MQSTVETKALCKYRDLVFLLRFYRELVSRGISFHILQRPNCLQSNIHECFILLFSVPS